LLLAGVDRPLADPDEIVEQLARQERRPLAPLVEDDLGQRLGRHVGARRVVDDAHLLPLPHPGRDLVEADVPALLGVVELTAFVALDQPDHGMPSCSTTLLSLRGAIPRESKLPHCGIVRQASCRGASRTVRLERPRRRSALTAAPAATPPDGRAPFRATAARRTAPESPAASGRGRWRTRAPADGRKRCRRCWRWPRR